MRLFLKVAERRTGGNSNSNIYQEKGKILSFSYLPNKAFILPEWHTCSSSGFKGHTGAIFCDTGLAGNGTSILPFIGLKITTSPMVHGEP